jgi:hypothetical protein
MEDWERRQIAIAFRLLVQEVSPDKISVLCLI